MKKFFAYILFFSFVYFSQANAITNYKFPEKPIDADFAKTS